MEVKHPVYPMRLLAVAVLLALITAVLHFYIGVWIVGGTNGLVLVLIGLVYLGGSILILVDYKRKLFLKIALVWVILVIVLWAASAAVNAVGTNNIFAYVDKADEIVLLAVLVRIRMLVK